MQGFWQEVACCSAVVVHYLAYCLFSVYKQCKQSEQWQLRYMLSQCSPAEVGVASALSVLSLHDALLLCPEGVTQLLRNNGLLPVLFRRINICMHLLMQLAVNGRITMYAVALQV